LPSLAQNVIFIIDTFFKFFMLAFRRQFSNLQTVEMCAATHGDIGWSFTTRLKLRVGAVPHDKIMGNNIWAIQCTATFDRVKSIQ
jgi:hypothetical protein